jgi:hypothetical protein
MSTNWLDGTDDWNTPSDWSAGLPVASSNVVINQGNPEVTASFGAVNSITNSATLDFIDAGASSVTNYVRNDGGVLAVDPFSGDGGSSLTIGDWFYNYGTIQIGPSDNTLSADSTVSIANLNVTTNAAFDLYGSSTARATFYNSSSGGSAGIVNADLSLSGDALFEYASGQFATIECTLSLKGSHAFVADASDTNSNSMLKSLNRILQGGRLELENGASVTTSGALTNSGAIALDGTSGDAGSLLQIDGKLTNTGTIDIGNRTLSATSTVEAGSLVNDGAINLHGNQQANVSATLHTTGAFTNDGSVNLSDDVLTNHDKIAGPVSGTGNFSLSKHSTLNFGGSVSSGETVNFHGADKLILGQPSSFDGTIDDFFTANDTVVLKGFAESATSLLYTQTGADSCSLTLSDGAHSAVLNFAGAPYAQSDFSLVPWYGGAGWAIRFVG